MTFYRKGEDGEFHAEHIIGITLTDHDRDNFFRAIAEYQIKKRCPEYITTFAPLTELTDLLQKCALAYPDKSMRQLIPVFVLTMEAMRKQQGKPPIRHDVVDWGTDVLQSPDDSKTREVVVTTLEENRNVVRQSKTQQRRTKRSKR